MGNKSDAGNSLQDGGDLSANGKGSERKYVILGLSLKKDAVQRWRGKLVSERKSNSQRVVTKEEGKCWTPWHLKIWWQDFSQLSSIRWVYKYSGDGGVSSFSFGLVAFWYMWYLCCFHIHDLGSFLQNKFNSLGGKETFSMLWNQLCSTEITCFYFLFVPLFLWVNYKSE